MQHDLGDCGRQPLPLSHLLGNPIGSNQQYPAVGAATASEADGLWSEAIAAAAVAAAAAAFSPVALNAGGQALQLTAGGSDTRPTGALDLLASLADDK